MELFADTSFLVALYNEKDRNHRQAKHFISELDNQSLFIISDYIFDEVLTVLLVRIGKFLSTQAGEKILADDRIQILQTDENIFQKAWLIYRMFEDKKWGFTDCTSYVFMKNLSIDAGVSFDEHFRQFGFKTLP